MHFSQSRLQMPILSRNEQFHSREANQNCRPKLVALAWPYLYCCMTRCKFSHGARICQGSCCSCTVASEQYLRCRPIVCCGSNSSSSNSNCNSSNNCNVVTVWYPRCHLPCLYRLYNKASLGLFQSTYQLQSNHSAYYIIFPQLYSTAKGIGPLC